MIASHPTQAASCLKFLSDTVNVCNKVDLATPLHAKLADSSVPPIADRLSAFVFALDTADLYRLQELTQVLTSVPNGK